MNQTQLQKTQFAQGLRALIRSQMPEEPATSDEEARLKQQHKQHWDSIHTKQQHKKLQLKLVDIDYDRLHNLIKHYRSITTLEQHESGDYAKQDNYQHCERMCEMTGYYIQNPRARLTALLGRLQKEAGNRQTVAEAWRWCCEYMQSSIDWTELMQSKKPVK